MTSAENQLTEINKAYYEYDLNINMLCHKLSLATCFILQPFHLDMISCISSILRFFVSGMKIEINMTATKLTDAKIDIVP